MRISCGCWKSDAHLLTTWESGWPNSKSARNRNREGLRARKSSRKTSRLWLRFSRRIQTILQLSIHLSMPSCPCWRPTVDVAPVDLIMSGIESQVTAQLVEAFKPLKVMLQSVKVSAKLNKDDPDFLDPDSMRVDKDEVVVRAKQVLHMANGEASKRRKVVALTLPGSFGAGLSCCVLDECPDS